MVFAKKKWGQNFLVDNNLLEKIINTVDLNKESRVLEIGPGHGALSEKIALKTKNLTMVEIDTDLIQSIKQNLAISHFPLLNQDILKTNIKDIDIDNPKVIGNIPYNITSPIIFWLIDNLTSSNYLPIREINYNYHLNGLDLLIENQSLAKQNIIDSLIMFDKMNRFRPNSILQQMFFQSKNDEIFNLFINYKSSTEINLLKDLLNRIAPFYSNKWNKL